MSMFSGIFQDIHSTDSGVEFSFEDIRFNLTDGQLEMDAAFEEMDRYFNAYDRLQDVVASIENYDGRLDTAVKEFVNSNNELAEALGISLEADEQQNGNAVQNAPEKKNIFARAWDAIVKFFKLIGRKIADFFRWVFSVFKKVKEKIATAEKNWSAFSPEEKKQFLDTAKCNVSKDLIISRFQAFTVIMDHVKTFAGKQLRDIMIQYYRNPSFIYNKKVADALTVYGGVIKDKASGRNMEDVISSPSAEFVGMTFTADWSKRPQSELKSFRENGWDESFVDNFFKQCQTTSNNVDDLDKIVKTLEDASAKASNKDFEDILNSLKAETSGFFFKYIRPNGVSFSETHRSSKEINKLEVDGFRKGITSVLQVLRMLVTASKEMFVTDNKLLDAFRNPQSQNSGK